MSTIVKPIPHTVDLNEPVKKTYIDTLLATEDNLAHRFDITLLQGGQAVAMPSGAAVTAYFIRYSDNATVPITNGAVNGNVASVTLTKACYNKPGQFAMIIKVSGGGIVNTVFYGEGTVYTSSTDKVVNDENIVPTLADLLAQIAAMEAATEASKTATTNAKSATTKANNAATSANSAATAANTAAEAANAAAQNWGNSTAADSNKLGGKPPEAYAAVNLLDNSDWRIKKNIVNQRGQSGYNGNVYTIDRWILWSDNGTGSVSIEDGQLAFNPGTSSGMSVAQRIEKGVLDSAKTYTLAWCDHANQIHVRTDRVSYGSAYDYVDFIVTEWVGVKWCALYEGEYTAETLPPYVPKGYIAELRECRRYFRLYKANMNTFPGFTISTGWVYMDIAFNEDMVAAPDLLLPTGKMYVEHLSGATSGDATHHASYPGRMRIKAEMAVPNSSAACITPMFDVMLSADL